MDRLLDYGDLGAIARAGFSLSPVLSGRSCASATTSSPSCSQSADIAPLLSSVEVRSPASNHSASSSFVASSLPIASDFPFSLPLSASSRPSFPRRSGFAVPGTSTNLPVYSAPFLPSLCPSLPEKLGKQTNQNNLEGCVSSVDLSTVPLPSSALQNRWSTPASINRQTDMATFDGKPFYEENPLASVKTLEENIPYPSPTNAERQYSVDVSASMTHKVPHPAESIAEMDMSMMQPTTSSRSAGTEKCSAAQNINISASRSTEDERPTGGRAVKKRKLVQKRVVHVPAMDSVSDKASSGESVPNDMWAWRKYGQKPIKGSPYPRSYYRCSSSKGCPARKQVERNPNDPSKFIVTYSSDHNHSWPTNRVNALAGCVRSIIAKPIALPTDGTSDRSTSTMSETSPDCDTINNSIFVNMDDGLSGSSSVCLEDASQYSIFGGGDKTLSLIASSPISDNASAEEAMACGPLEDACSLMEPNLGIDAYPGLSGSLPENYPHIRDPIHTRKHHESEMLLSGDGEGIRPSADATSASFFTQDHHDDLLLRSAMPPSCLPVVYDEQAQIFDALLSEMLAEILHSQNKAYDYGHTSS
ncbi:hypothetical protein KP509_22G053300 [Ceratopteris richardii]|uniref:WRKY domain-containing protein n=1 Tax=Ceratopteris richardii TaxID=49495 RepID=A0A8T2S8C8_CERRI|nr:hypothetical protein KP509_22G053300 [Ceratopteris richardii]